jgi:hypothetical protein
MISLVCDGDKYRRERWHAPLGYSVFASRARLDKVMRKFVVVGEES